MFTLIGLGVASAFGFSLVALLFPASLPGGHAHGMPAVYFEAAAVITMLELLGQVLELRARSQHSGAIRAPLSLTPPQAHRIAAGYQSHAVDLKPLRVGARPRLRPRKSS